MEQKWAKESAWLGPVDTTRPDPPSHPQGPVPSLLLSSGNKYGLFHSLWKQIISHLPSSNLVKPSCTPSYPPLTGSPVSHSGIAGEVWGYCGWLVTVPTHCCVVLLGCWSHVCPLGLPHVPQVSGSGHRDPPKVGVLSRQLYPYCGELSHWPKGSGQPEGGPSFCTSWCPVPHPPPQPQEPTRREGTFLLTL